MIRSKGGGRTHIKAVAKGQRFSVVIHLKVASMTTDMHMDDLDLIGEEDKARCYCINIHGKGDVAVNFELGDMLTNKALSMGDLVKFLRGKCTIYVAVVHGNNDKISIPATRAAMSIILLDMADQGLKSTIMEKTTRDYCRSTWGHFLGGAQHRSDRYEEGRDSLEDLRNSDKVWRFTQTS